MVKPTTNKNSKNTVVKHVCPINDTHCKVIFLQPLILRSVVTVINLSSTIVVLVLKSQSIRTLYPKIYESRTLKGCLQ